MGNMVNAWPYGSNFHILPLNFKNSFKRNLLSRFHIESFS